MNIDLLTKLVAHVRLIARLGLRKAVAIKHCLLNQLSQCNGEGIDQIGQLMEGLLRNFMLPRKSMF